MQLLWSVQRRDWRTLSVAFTECELKLKWKQKMKEKRNCDQERGGSCRHGWCGSPGGKQSFNYLPLILPLLWGCWEARIVDSVRGVIPFEKRVTKNRPSSVETRLFELNLLRESPDHLEAFGLTRPEKAQRPWDKQTIPSHTVTSY